MDRLEWFRLWPLMLRYADSMQLPLRRMKSTSLSWRISPPRRSISSPDSFPQHSRALTRVIEGVDQRFDRLLGADKHTEHGGAQRKILDSLGGPFGFQLGAGDAPDFFGVGLEEGLEQSFAETVGDPLLERVLHFVGKELPAQVTGENQDAFEVPQSHQGVERLERVVEELFL